MPPLAPESEVLLPHRPPFRLLDRVVSADPERGKLVAERRLTANDALWPAEASLAVPMPDGRFPEVLLIEALCQAAACLNSLQLAGSTGSPGDHLGYLVAISDFKFQAPQELGAKNFQPIQIGETLILHVERQGSLGALCAFHTRAEALPPDPAAQPREIAAGRLLFAVSPK